MTDSRETCDLIWIIKQIKKDRKYYIKRIWYVIKNNPKLTFEDTFYPLICKIFGHKRYLCSGDSYPEEYACKRCHRFIN